jgi:hypothetical protein
VSAFHYKGVLVAVRPDGWEYRFFPDFFRTEDEWGRFLVDPKTWEATVIEEVHDETGPVSWPTRSVSALVHRIRREAEVTGIPPQEVTHIA